MTTEQIRAELKALDNRVYQFSGDSKLEIDARLAQLAEIKEFLTRLIARDGRKAAKRRSGRVPKTPQIESRTPIATRDNETLAPVRVAVKPSPAALHRR